MSAEIRTEVFLIAVEVETTVEPHQRGVVQDALYEHLDVLRNRPGLGPVSWWDAGVDANDGNDNDRAVWVRFGHEVEAQRYLYNEGLTDAEDMRLGEHPSVGVTVVGDSHYFVCDRCDETAEDAAALAVVPCADLSMGEHGHLWKQATVGPAFPGVECHGCDLRIMRSWHPSMWGPGRYEVFDVNGSRLASSDSWGIAAFNARDHGGPAWIFDHETRSWQMTPEQGEEE